MQAQSYNGVLPEPRARAAVARGSCATIIAVAVAVTLAQHCLSHLRSGPCSSVRDCKCMTREAPPTVPRLTELRVRSRACIEGSSTIQQALVYHARQVIIFECSRHTLLVIELLVYAFLGRMGAWCY